MGLGPNKPCVREKRIKVSTLEQKAFANELGIKLQLNPSTAKRINMYEKVIRKLSAMNRPHPSWLTLIECPLINPSRGVINKFHLTRR